jgi:MYND finger
VYCSKACQLKHWTAHKPACLIADLCPQLQLQFNKDGVLCGRPLSHQSLAERSGRLKFYGCLYLDTGEDFDCAASQLRGFDHQLSTGRYAHKEALVTFDVIATIEQLQSHAAHRVALEVVQYASRKKHLRPLPCIVGVTINELNRPARGPFLDSSDSFQQWRVFNRCALLEDSIAAPLADAALQCAVPRQDLRVEQLAQYLEHHRVAAAAGVQSTCSCDYCGVMRFITAQL